MLPVIRDTSTPSIISTTASRVIRACTAAAAAIIPFSIIVPVILVPTSASTTTSPPIILVSVTVPVPGKESQWTKKILKDQEASEVSIGC